MGRCLNQLLEAETREVQQTSATLKSLHLFGLRRRLKTYPLCDGKTKLNEVLQSYWIVLGPNGGAGPRADTLVVGNVERENLSGTT